MNSRSAVNLPSSSMIPSHTREFGIKWTLFYYEQASRGRVGRVEYNTCYSNLHSIDGSRDALAGPGQADHRPRPCGYTHAKGLRVQCVGDVAVKHVSKQNNYSMAMFIMIAYFFSGVYWSFARWCCQDHSLADQSVYSTTIGHRSNRESK